MSDSASGNRPTMPPQPKKSEPELSCETLVSAAQVLTMSDCGAADIIEQGCIAIQGGRIAAVGTETELTSRYRSSQRVSLPEHVLLPGLVNTHGHAAMTLLRGLGDGHGLASWLETVIWPLEQRLVSAEFVRDGTDLALLEMLRSGTTCFSDMYFFPEVAAARVQQAGLRTQLAFPILEAPTAWSDGAEDALNRGMSLLDQWRHDPLIDVAFGPHSLGTVPAPILQKVQMYADELDARVQIHLHETPAEANAKGGRAITQLEQLGLLSPRLQAVHMTQITPAEFDLLAQYQVPVSHCPASNMKLASGICPVVELQARGICVGLGTDGAAANNSLNLFTEARLAALLGKITSGSDTMSAASVLRMATIDGARVLGLDQDLGSLDVGKWADIIAVDTRNPGLQPMHNAMAQLVHCAGNFQASDVWVAGRRLLSSGELLTLDEADIVRRAQQWRGRIDLPTNERVSP